MRACACYLQCAQHLTQEGVLVLVLDLALDFCRSAAAAVPAMSAGAVV